MALRWTLPTSTLLDPHERAKLLGRYSAAAEA